MVLSKKNTVMNENERELGKLFSIHVLVKVKIESVDLNKKIPLIVWVDRPVGDKPIFGIAEMPNGFLKNRNKTLIFVVVALSVIE